MTFGEKVKSLRELAGMTQGELAEKAGLETKSAISKIENNQRTTPFATAKRIASALNIPVANLIEESEPVDHAVDFLPYLRKADKNTLDIIRKILGMPEEA